MKKDLILVANSVSTYADHGDTVTKAEGVDLSLLIEQLSTHEVVCCLEVKSVIAELISIHGVEAVNQMVLDWSESKEWLSQ